MGWWINIRPTPQTTIHGLTLYETLKNTTGIGPQAIIPRHIHVYNWNTAWDIQHIDPPVQTVTNIRIRLLRRDPRD